ncbi:MAG: hypothetical protein KC468_01895, partial [Myxococcales bacterium]|nr:hypothetical protein [Myxococcales bacterium]
GRPTWKRVRVDDLPMQLDLVPLGAWPADDQEDSESVLTTWLASGRATWSELGWQHTDEAWLVDMWRRWGVRVVTALARDDLAFPVLEGGTLRVLEGDEAARVPDRVIPPTPDGWLTFVDLIPTASSSMLELERVAMDWWGCELPKPKPTKDSAIRCPESVEVLRPESIAASVRDEYDDLDLDRVDWRAAPFTVAITGEHGAEWSLQLAFAKPPKFEEFFSGVLRSIFATYAARVRTIATATQRAREGEINAETWAELAELRRDDAEALADLRALVGTEAADTIDHCARHQLGVDVPVDEIVRRVFDKYREKPYWWKLPDHKRLMRRDLRRELRARGVQEPDDYVKEAMAAAIAEAEFAPLRRASGLLVLSDSMAKLASTLAADLDQDNKVREIEAAVITARPCTTARATTRVWVNLTGGRLHIRQFTEPDHAAANAYQLVLAREGTSWAVERLTVPPDVGDPGLNQDLEVIDAELHEEQTAQAVELLRDIEHAMEGVKGIKRQVKLGTEVTYVPRHLLEKPLPASVSAQWWMNRSPWRAGDFEAAEQLLVDGVEARQTQRSSQSVKLAPRGGAARKFELPKSHPQLLRGTPVERVPLEIVELHRARRTTKRSRSRGVAKHEPEVLVSSSPYLALTFNPSWQVKHVGS